MVKTDSSADAAGKAAKAAAATPTPAEDRREPSAEPAPAPLPQTGQPPLTIPEPLWGAKAESAKTDTDKAKSETDPGADPFAEAVSKPSFTDAGDARPLAEGAPPPPLGPDPIDAAAPRRSAVPLLLAGVVTAGLGLGAGWALWAPGGPFADTSALDDRFAALEARLAAASASATSAGEAATGAKGEISALTERLTAAEAALPPVTEALTEVRSLSSQSAEAVATLSARLTELAQRPPATDPGAVAAYERELAALRQTFDAELAQIRSGTDKALAEIHATLGSELARIEAQAQAAAEASEASAVAQAEAERTAALTALGTAIDSGLPLAEPMARLAELAPDLAVAGLHPHADGVPTLLALQEAFPAAARAALAAEAVSGSGAAGVTGALKGFFGVRSLAPQAGSSADAILSRAEASLATGDVAKALDELASLSPAPAAEMAGWRSKAEQRLAALAAYQSLSDAVEK